jgi:hypothetical protein
MVRQPESSKASVPLFVQYWIVSRYFPIRSLLSTYLARLEYVPNARSKEHLREIGYPLCQRQGFG